MMEPHPPADIDGIMIEEASLPARVGGAAETNLRPQNDEADRQSLPEPQQSVPFQLGGAWWWHH
jgi:hypothetical protein